MQRIRQQINSNSVHDLPQNDHLPVDVAAETTYDGGTGSEK